MQIALFFGVYEAEKPFASDTLGMFLDVLKAHDVHVLILDDASKSFVANDLALTYGNRPNVTIEVVRLEKSSGFRGAMDRTVFAYRHIAGLNKKFDAVVRLDADLFVTRSDLAKLFDSNILPTKGMVGPGARFRARDFVQIFADILPFGFRRRRANGVIENGWELKRLSPVWWWDLGIRALWNGFRMTYLGGSFQIIAGETLRELHKRGWLDRKPLHAIGLVFGEDVGTNIMVKALNHPLIDFSDLILDWSCDMAINRFESNPALVRRNRHYIIHPLKADEWSMQMRRELTTAVSQAPLQDRDEARGQ